MTKTFEAVVLAGGLGTRLRSVVQDVPKPMAPVKGRPFLAHLLDYWIGQGVTHFVLSVGYKSEIVEEYFKKEYHGAAISYAVEKTPLGTGGGLIFSMKHLMAQNPFLLINGDTFFETNLEQMMKFHQSHGAQATIALRKLEQNSRYGVVKMTAERRIIDIGAKDPEARHCEINGGVGLFERDLFTPFLNNPGPLTLESEIFTPLMASGKGFYGYSTQNKFLDIGIPEDYRAAEAFFRDEKY